jgi:hypothetical protein
MNYLEAAQRVLRERQARRAQSDLERDGLSLWPTHSVNYGDIRIDATPSVLEIRVPFLTDTLFFVSSLNEVSPLLSEGITRGRIWTANELNDLFNTPGLGPRGRLKIALARALFDGEVIAVLRREVSEESEVSPPSDGRSNQGREESEVSEERPSDG